MKALFSSLVISGGLYFGYQLKLGPYSGSGEILEVKVPAKRFHYYEIEQSYYKSEIEISKFINELIQKNIFGTFHKIQLDDPDVQSGSKRYLIGVEETMENMHKLKQYQEKLKVQDMPSYSAVESHLNYDKKSSLFIALQMTLNVQSAIQKYVVENKLKFEGINPEQYLKTITIGSNKKFLQTSVSYPFGEGSDIFLEISKKIKENQVNKKEPQQQQQPSQQTTEK